MESKIIKLLIWFALVCLWNFGFPEALPIYEQATMITVERFLKNKFYNDIFYVKEKLQRRLQKSFAAKMESAGRIKKVKFEEFVVK